jgi:hypothetical protein
MLSLLQHYHQPVARQWWLCMPWVTTALALLVLVEVTAAMSPPFVALQAAQGGEC